MPQDTGCYAASVSKIVASGRGTPARQMTDIWQVPKQAGSSMTNTATPTWTTDADGTPVLAGLTAAETSEYFSLAHAEPGVSCEEAQARLRTLRRKHLEAARSAERDTLSDG